MSGELRAHSYAQVYGKHNFMYSQGPWSPFTAIAHHITRFPYTRPPCQAVLSELHTASLLILTTTCENSIVI